MPTSAPIRVPTNHSMAPESGKLFHSNSDVPLGIDSSPPSPSAERPTSPSIAKKKLCRVARRLDSTTARRMLNGLAFGAVKVVDNAPDTVSGNVSNVTCPNNITGISNNIIDAKPNTDADTCAETDMTVQNISVDKQSLTRMSDSSTEVQSQTRLDQQDVHLDSYSSSQVRSRQNDEVENGDKENTVPSEDRRRSCGTGRQVMFSDDVVVHRFDNKGRRLGCERRTLNYTEPGKHRQPSPPQHSIDTEDKDGRDDEHLETSRAKAVALEPAPTDTSAHQLQHARSFSGNHAPVRRLATSSSLRRSASACSATSASTSAAMTAVADTRYAFVHDPEHGTLLQLIVSLGVKQRSHRVQVTANESGDTICVQTVCDSSSKSGGADGFDVKSPPVNLRYSLPVRVDPYRVTACLRSGEGILKVTAPVIIASKLRRRHTVAV